ncbi:glycerophosphoryl diester phosphodiesterase family protein [Grosmannia clavigera kw1407]|uniref:Glycerophosphoryl diester phosphodiesterase family protein n=1 Tax=Grosmannia clavigera (strain kw1407 / UAMH 11150) TaxID=655863 RepID=F0XG86_GROCL|nr:glycerophosphoryl diester phosphodiesterase family protein [Grosmannia clavigera kw1407]EFX03301.1 glycerophosphoryl diester phosphodiesterase family protein [Grosmannia clavigera kw1407]
MSLKMPSPDGNGLSPLPSPPPSPPLLSGGRPRLPASLAAFSPASLHGSSTATVPLNIAHRGFKARWPENSLAAFRAALDPTQGGAQAIETDVHLSRDGAVVLSHDPTLRRCFGRPERICDCDWAMLATLRTERLPGEPMARLADVLELLAEPANETAWVLLDIKRDDPPQELLQRVAETVEAAPGDWAGRIVLGCWQAVAMRICRELMPSLPVAYIGFSLSCAEALLAHHPDVVQVFNMEQHVLVGSRGARFVRAAQDELSPAGRHSVLAWTVNDPEWMEWSIRRGLDGVITDDPAAYDKVLRRRRSEAAQKKLLMVVDENTPLQTAGNETAVGPFPHPPASSTLTGFFIRRWARLYAWTGFVKGVAIVFNSIMWVRNGSWQTHLQKTLGQ